MIIDEEYVRLMVREELTKPEVRSIVRDNIEDFIKQREFEARVKELTADVLEQFFKMMYNKRGFWKGDVKK